MWVKIDDLIDPVHKKFELEILQEQTVVDMEPVGKIVEKGRQVGNGNRPKLELLILKIDHQTNHTQK